MKKSLTFSFLLLNVCAWAQTSAITDVRFSPLFVNAASGAIVENRMLTTNYWYQGLPYQGSSATTLRGGSATYQHDFALPKGKNATQAIVNHKDFIGLGLAVTGLSENRPTEALFHTSALLSLGFAHDFSKNDLNKNVAAMALTTESDFNGGWKTGLAASFLQQKYMGVRWQVGLALPALLYNQNTTIENLNRAVRLSGSVDFKTSQHFGLSFGTLYERQPWATNYWETGAAFRIMNEEGGEWRIGAYPRWLPDSEPLIHNSTMMVLHYEMQNFGFGMSYNINHYPYGEKNLPQNAQFNLRIRLKKEQPCDAILRP